MLDGNVEHGTQRQGKLKNINKNKRIQEVRDFEGIMRADLCAMPLANFNNSPLELFRPQFWDGSLILKCMISVKLRITEGNLINLERRKALKTGGGLGLLGILTTLGLVNSGMALAKDEKSPFDAKTLDEALDALGVVVPESNAAVHLTVPEIAENGAVVPVTVESSLANTQQVYILVEKNPSSLAASFSFPEGTEGFVTTRIKMRETSNVIALVKAGGKFYRASREVKVTAGGCGG
jgi:sulfur-oxidizing protein SoxY